MDNSRLFCPKCGRELARRLGSWYECINEHCHYRLSETDTIDISFNSKGISKALSNLCSYPFVIDGVHCASMESFIQSLKVEDLKLQEDICSKPGAFISNIKTIFDDWRISQTVHWKGKEIGRHSNEYMNLLKRAYRSLYEQSNLFKYALEKTKGYRLIHSIGCNDDTETLLTPHEFVNLLNMLRE